MKLWTKLYRWLSGYDAKMRVLASLSRDEARYWIEGPNWFDIEKEVRVGKVLQVRTKTGGVFDLVGYKLTDAGVQAVEEWRAGR